MKFLVQDNVIIEGPLRNYPKMVTDDNGVQHPLRELASKGHDVTQYGWVDYTAPVPAYNPETHNLGDTVYSLENGSIVGQYQTIPLSTEQLAVVQENKKQKEKLTGIEFEGVMCSATAEDMWGLSAIKDWIAAGQSTPFKFENGNTLLITPKNLDNFEAVWVPFRASFF